MTILAEISDKIVSPGQIWAIMGVASAFVGALALALRSWGALFLAIPIAALGCWLVLGFRNDAILGDAVLQENRKSWFASGLGASMLPIATVIVAVMWSKRSRCEDVGFETLYGPFQRTGYVPPTNK